jgi:hypothetical protein
VRTPGLVERLDLWLDESGRPFALDGKDVAFLRAGLRDANGTPVPDAWENVSFGATGDVALVGANPFSSEAGVASILVQAEIRRPRAAVYALALVPHPAGIRTVSAALSLGGDVEPWEVRGTDPGAPGGRVRATLFVGGRAVVTADSGAPKFRIAGSKAPVRPG